MTVKNTEASSPFSLTRRTLPGAVRTRRWIVARHERDALVGTDGGAGGPAAGALGQSEWDEGRRPRRRRVGDGRRLRAREARIQRQHSRGARSRRRCELDAAARRDTHRGRSGRRNAGLQLRRGHVSQRRALASRALAHRRPWILQGARACRSSSSSTRTSRPTSTTRATNIGPLADKRVRLREVKADMIGYTCELMAKAVNQDTLDRPLTADDKEKFVSFLVSEGYLDSADHAYKKNSGRGPGDPHDFQALLQSGFGNRIRSVLDGTGRRRCSSPSAAWISFRRAFSESSATRSRSAPRSSRFARPPTA